MLLMVLSAGVQAPAQAPNLLLVELDAGGGVRVQGRAVSWPHLPVELVREFEGTATAPVILVRAAPGVTVWNLGTSMRMLRRFSSAAASASPFARVRPLVLPARDRRSALPERVPLHLWLVQRFVRGR